MKYLVGAAIFFVVIILAIVLLVTRSPRQERQAEQPRTTQATDYANTNSKMVYTLQGPVVGNDARRSVRITVTSTNRTIEQINGYQGQVVNSKTYTNNMEGYQYFLASLNNAGYTKERRTRTPDSQGACAIGQTYIFEIIDGTDIAMNRWSSSCGGQGTYGGNTANTRILFENQITDYSQFISDIDL